MMNEIVYLLTNPSIPDLLKIGRTKNLEERMRSLSSHSGVPAPFECFYACKVADADEVEKRVHDAFADHARKDDPQLASRGGSGHREQHLATCVNVRIVNSIAVGWPHPPDPRFLAPLRCSSESCSCVLPSLSLHNDVQPSHRNATFKAATV